MKKVDFDKPGTLAGMHHVALFVNKLEECVEFYTSLLGMEIEWQPDEDNVYLCSGTDNLALHRAPKNAKFAEPQRLDHIGFIVDEIEKVDDWYDFLRDHQITLSNVPKTHRDGARSFYCADPDGTSVQIIYHPPLSKS